MSSLGLILTALTATITMAANLMMRAGIDRAGGFSPATAMAVVTDFIGLLLQPLFAMGFLAYFLAGLVWFRVVALEPLSIAYPVLVSMTFIFVSGGAILLFNEPASLRKVFGLIMVIMGITVASTGAGGR